MRFQGATTPETITLVVPVTLTPAQKSLNSAVEVRAVVVSGKQRKPHKTSKSNCKCVLFFIDSKLINTPQ